MGGVLLLVRTQREPGQDQQPLILPPKEQVKVQGGGNAGGLSGLAVRPQRAGLPRRRLLAGDLSDCASGTMHSRVGWVLFLRGATSRYC